MKRGGRVNNTIFPDKPITKKPAETRRGSGKGNPEERVNVVKPGRIMFEDKKFACRARGYNKNEKVDVVIRPEHLDIGPRAEGMLKGTVKPQLFKGMHYETVVETRVGTSITV